MIGHAPEFGGHDAETVGHAPPKYAISTGDDEGPEEFNQFVYLVLRGPLMVALDQARLAQRQK